MRISSSCRITLSIGDYSSVSVTTGGEIDVDFGTKEELSRKQAALALSIAQQCDADITSAMALAKAKKSGKPTACGDIVSVFDTRETI
jgi:hypothetical protein